MVVRRKAEGGGKSKRGKRPAAAERPELARYKVEAVSRAMLILSAFKHGPSTLGVEEIANRTGVGASAVDATLRTLESRGLVQRSGDDGTSYRLGLAWLRLADVKRQQLDLRAVALPVMRRMRDAVNETVSLGIRIGSNRVNIEYAESLHEVRRIVQTGFHVALHVGAGGLVLMSGMDDVEIETYLAPIAISQMQKSKLVAAIKQTRKDGYAMVEGEITSDTAAISAPVRDHVGDIVAALTISLPVHRLSSAMRARCTRAVVRGAEEISLAMGFDAARAA
jgi:DNA-binding IclR family transcriptional regulator